MNLESKRISFFLQLPCYINLCEDDVWGVRKVCAEVIMSVSCVCSPTSRKMALAPVFTKLLQDANRWVRMSAFQALGPFISTFADPAITKLFYNNKGELMMINTDGQEFRLVVATVMFIVRIVCITEHFV